MDHSLQTDFPVSHRPGAPFSFRPNSTSSSSSSSVSSSGSNDVISAARFSAFRSSSSLPTTTSSNNNASSGSQKVAVSYWNRGAPPSSSSSPAQQQADWNLGNQRSTFRDLNARKSARDNVKYDAAAAAGTSVSMDSEHQTSIPQSPVSRVFFSADNEEALQAGLRDGVLALCAQPGHVGPALEISRQDLTGLRAVMRDVFLTHYADRVPADRADVGSQVAVFNAWVWREMVPTLYSAARQQYHYLAHFREPIPVAAFTKQADRDFHDDIDGRRRLQFSASIYASGEGGGGAAAAGRNQFVQSLRRDVTSNAMTDRGNINRLTAAVHMQER